MAKNRYVRVDWLKTQWDYDFCCVYVAGFGFFGELFGFESKIVEGGQNTNNSFHLNGQVELTVGRGQMEFMWKWTTDENIGLKLLSYRWRFVVSFYD